MEDSAPDPTGSIALEIPRDLHDAMVAHCLRETPLECCGILGGVAPSGFEANATDVSPPSCRGFAGAIAPRVSSIHPLRNAAASESRYYADENDLIAAYIALRQRGADILAIYHSHPRWQAVPSRTDLRENYYGPVPRIIVSLLEAIPVVRIWRLDPDTFQELRWRIVEPTAPGPLDRGRS